MERIFREVGHYREDFREQWLKRQLDSLDNSACTSTSPSSISGMYPDGTVPSGFDVTVVLVSGEETVISFLQKDYPIQLIKLAIQNKLGIARNQQRLIFDGKEVVEGWEPLGESASRQLTLEDYGIQEGSTLQLVVIASAEPTPMNKDEDGNPFDPCQECGSVLRFECPGCSFRMPCGETFCANCHEPYIPCDRCFNV